MVTGCDRNPDTENASSSGGEQTPVAVEVYGVPEPALSPEELERGRLDPSWRQVVRMDPVPGTDTVPNHERWEQISPAAVNGAPIHLPVSGNVAGPSAFGYGCFWIVPSSRPGASTAGGG
jgi:hypothetical protein